MRRVVLAALAVVVGSVVAYSQQHHRLGSSISGGQNPTTPGGSNTQLQFNTSSSFGGISGVTSDGASVGFATSSNLVLYGQTAGNCLTVNTNSQVISQSCSAGSQTSIAAGSNITTSGSAGNVTVNVVATPSFTTVIASGNLTAGSAQFTGAVSGTTAQFQTYTGSTLNLTGNLTGTTAQFSGLVTATTANIAGQLVLQGLSGCLQASAGTVVATGVNCATQTSTPSIAAGSNITTSGTAANTTINVVATPSFTTVIATGNLTATTAQVSGWLTASGAALQTATIAGNLTGSTANFSGNLTAGTAQLLGQLTGTSAVFQTVTVNNLTPTGPNCLQETNGVLQATNAACASPTSTSIAAGSNITTSGTATNITVNVVATPSFSTVIATGNLTAATAQFSGLLTGTNAVFQTVTVNNLTPTGPNCLQETNGVLQATNAACATPTSVSIAQGNNIVTSGTATNITVTATPTGPSGAVQFDNAGVFGGDSGFQYAGSSSGIVTLTLGTVTTTNDRALSLIGTWSNSTTTFGAPLFVNITTNTSSANTTSGFGVGSRLVDIQATSISVLSISPSGSLSSAALQSSATQCLQASSGGLVFGTAVPCATQTSTPSIAAGSNITTSGTAANTTINVVATPSFTTVIATSNLTASTVLGVVGWLTAPGVNIQTATLAGNLTGTSANFSTNLTANIAQFAGFLSAGGASLSGLTIQTETLSSNLTGTTANFSSNLTANIAQFAGFMSAGGASLSGLTIQTGTFSGNLTGTTANFSSILTASVYTGTPTGAGIMSFISPGVAQFATAGYAPTPTGWINWGGESRVSANPFLTVTVATLTPIGLSVNLQGGRTYSIEADVYLGVSVNTGGVQAALTGSYGSSNTAYFGYVVDGGSNTSAAGTSNPIRGATLATAKNSVVANTVLSGPTGWLKITGTVSASSSGTLTVQAAQNTANSTHPLTITQGSRLIVHDMP